MTLPFSPPLRRMMRRGRYLLAQGCYDFGILCRDLAPALMQRRRLATALGLSAGVAVSGYLGMADYSAHQQLLARLAETRNAARASARLQRYEAKLRGEADTMTAEIRGAEAQIAARQAAAAAVRSSLSAAQQRLAQLKTNLPGAPAPAATAPAAAPGAAAAEVAQLRQALAAADRQRQIAIAQRAQIVRRFLAVSTGLARAQDRAGELKEALARLQTKLAALGRPSAAARIAAAAAPGILGTVKRTLSSAGIDAERFLASFGIKRDVGGPFIPIKDAPSAAQLTSQQAAVARMLKTLPVDAPLRSYRETSPFGARTDPINGRAGFHPGVDLAAPYDTPIFATAPGVVSYAGWENGYGKIVKIDHGHGLSTGYAHMHRFAVVVGERVKAGTVIGYVGTTGRTTGPHVHYEVRMNGVPVNPTPFLALGHEIVPGGGRVISVATRY